MSKSGRIRIYNLDGKLEKIIEPINEHPERNADWKIGVSNLPTDGSITEEESIITEENGFTNIKRITPNP